MRELTILFIFSLASIASPIGDCELNFLLSFKKQPKFTSEVLNRQSTRKKVASLEEDFTYFVDDFIEDMDALGTHGYSPMAVRRVIEDNTKPFLKNLTNFQKELKKIGVKTKITKYEHSTSGAQISRLDFVSSPSKKKANALLKKLRKRFKLKTVSFDPMGNTLGAAGGYLEPASMRIELGFSGIKSLISGQELTMVGKHEFTHASFIRKRRNNIKSIYHSSYHTTGLKKLSKTESSYQYFMSSEELYTFANNAFWNSSLFKRVETLGADEVLSHLAEITSYLKYTERLAKQTSQLSSRFYRDGTFSLYEQNYKKLFLVDELGNVSNSVNSAKRVRLFDAKNERFLEVWLSKEDKKNFSELFKKQKKLKREFHNEVSSLSDRRKTKSLNAKFQAEESKLNAPFYKPLLESMLIDQKRLKAVSEGLLVKNKEVIKLHEKVYKKIRRLEEKGVLDLKDPEIKILLLDLRKKYRELGNVVKEDFKGFLGNL